MTPDDGPRDRLAEGDTNGGRWPRTIGGYNKVIGAAVGVLVTPEVLNVLQQLDIANAPGWLRWLITAAVTILTVLLNPKNKDA